VRYGMEPEEGGGAFKDGLKSEKREDGSNEEDP
jgi:hypothetical protein